MDYLLRLAAFVIVLTFVLAVESTNADIFVHGSTTAYQETGGDWLTMGTNDIDGSGGLGSDGYLFYGNFTGSSENSLPYNSNFVASLPSYVTSHGPAGDFTSIAHGFAAYGAIDDPNLLNGTDQLAGIALGTGGAAGTSRDLVTFDVGGLVAGQTVRVGVLAGIESNSDGRWDPTSLTLSDGLNFATVGDHTLSPLAINPGGTNTGWAFFDIDADGTYTVSGTKRLAGQGASISGLTFDSQVVPEPASILLWSLAGLFSLAFGLGRSLRSR